MFVNFGYNNGVIIVLFEISDFVEGESYLYNIVVVCDEDNDIVYILFG